MAKHGICTICGEPWSVDDPYHGCVTPCACVDTETTPDRERDEDYERAAARARANDFEDTHGRDWT